MGPAPRHPIKDLTSISLSAQYRFTVWTDQRLPVVIPLGNPGLPEILLCQNIDGELGPLLGNINIIELKYHRSVWIPDFRRPFHKRKPFVGTVAATCEFPVYFHDNPPSRGLGPDNALYFE